MVPPGLIGNVSIRSPSTFDCRDSRSYADSVQVLVQPIQQECNHLPNRCFGIAMVTLLWAVTRWPYFLRVVLLVPRELRRKLGERILEIVRLIRLRSAVQQQLRSRSTDRPKRRRDSRNRCKAARSKGGGAEPFTEMGVLGRTHKGTGEYSGTCRTTAS